MKTVKAQNNTRITHCEKKHWSPPGVVNTTDDDCEQQIPSVALIVYNS